MQKIFCLVLLCMLGWTVSLHARARVAEVKSCQSHCLSKFQACAKICDDSCEQCKMTVKNSVARHYAEFVHQQIVMGGLIAREPTSYKDPLQCLKFTCDCRADYAQCDQSCTGIIHKRLQVPMTCA